MKEIKLTHGFVALVDDEDFEKVNAFKWSTSFVHKRHYALRNDGGKTVMMHRFIMRPSHRDVVDHVDRDGLNNQKSNLRLCTPSQNNMNRDMLRNNTSGFTGVSFFKRHQKWLPQLRFKGKAVWLGLYDTKEEAQDAYLKARLKYLGDFA